MKKILGFPGHDSKDGKNPIFERNHYRSKVCCQDTCCKQVTIIIMIFMIMSIFKIIMISLCSGCRNIDCATTVQPGRRHQETLFMQGFHQHHHHHCHRHHHRSSLTKDTRPWDSVEDLACPVVLTSSGCASGHDDDRVRVVIGKSEIFCKIHITTRIL